MGEVVEAIYENGVLKPLKKLNLKEGEKVKVEIKKTSKNIEKILETAKKYRIKVDEDLLEQFIRERR